MQPLIKRSSVRCLLERLLTAYLCGLPVYVIQNLVRIEIGTVIVNDDMARKEVIAEMTRRWC